MPELSLQVVSDLHLETPLARPIYEEFDIEPDCPHLALLGDIGHVLDNRLFKFFHMQLLRFETVFFLLGNHEPFNTSFVEAERIISTFVGSMDKVRLTTPGLGQFVFLNRSRFDISQEFTILGCTLFSQIKSHQKDTVRMFVSDFSSIENWTVEDHCGHHQADLEWLNQQVAQIAQQEPTRSVIIFSHHCPTSSKEANDPRHWNDSAGVNSAFLTDLSQQICWTCPNVKLWAFGHTHFNCDYVDEQTGKRVLANQKGYKRSEAEGFDAQKIVSLGSTVDILSRTEAQQASKTSDRQSHGTPLDATTQSTSSRKTRRRRIDSKCTMS